MSNLIKEKVTSVHHWNDTLFSFTTSRDPGFRFKNGHFVMIGLETEGKPLMRAYSIASANYEEELEFFSIKVQDGPFLFQDVEFKENGGYVTIPEGIYNLEVRVAGVQQEHAFVRYFVLAHLGFPFLCLVDSRRGVCPGDHSSGFLLYFSIA